MPRVNRDLQRRMAARRERERRRPSGERRYRFASPEPSLETDQTGLDEVLDADVLEDAATTEDAPRRRASRDGSAAGRSRTGGASARGITAPRPFSAYRDEYAYVYGDLRRVGLVIGSLLVILVVLSYVLSNLVR